MPERENVVADKSFAFAVRVVPCCRSLQAGQKEFVLSKQLLRSGTSIGANVEEAIGGASRKDFIHKLHIAYKEAREIKYWLRLLGASGRLPAPEGEPLLAQNCCASWAAFLNPPSQKIPVRNRPSNSILNS